MPPTWSATYDTLYSSTWAYRSPKIFDSAMQITPSWYILSKKGRSEPRSGGYHIQEPIQYAQNASGTWTGRGRSITISNTDILTMSQWDWKYYTIHMVRYFADEQKNKGKQQATSIVRANIDNAKSTIGQDLEVSTFGDGTGDGNLACDGLDNIIAEDPTTGTVGNIPRETYPYWRNQYEDFDATYTLEVDMLQRMDNMFNNCSIYGDPSNRFPTQLLTTQTLEQQYTQEAREMGMVTMNADPQMVDLGFGELKHKGAPITWSPQCKAQSMYFITHNNLRWVYDPAANMKMGPWIDLPTQPFDRLAHIMVAGNMICSCPRKQGVIFDMV